MTQVKVAQENPVFGFKYTKVNVIAQIYLSINPFKLVILGIPHGMLARGTLPTLRHNLQTKHVFSESPRSEAVGMTGMLS
jgi:hypothetical protein